MNPDVRMTFYDLDGKRRTVVISHRDYMSLLQGAEAREARERDKARQEEERVREQFKRAEEKLKETADAFSDFSATFSSSGTRGGPSFHDIFGDIFEDVFTPPQPPPSSGRYYSARDKKPTSHSIWARLCAMAGVPFNTPRSEQAKVIRKAQRKCHPDTGGSHEKWIELDKLIGSL